MDRPAPRQQPATAGSRGPSAPTITPITLRDARRFIAAHHGHNVPPRGWLFGAAIRHDDGELAAVAMAGRPVNRVLDDGYTVEVTRVCIAAPPGSPSTRNYPSRLYGALNRAAAALGYRRSITYTVAGETAASVRAAGYGDPVELELREWWASADRPRYDATIWGERTLPEMARVRWTRAL
jgi:hypothetical protein